MIIHPYAHGEHEIIDYYGKGFGSMFARIFSKVAAKTASRAALSAAKRVGSTLVKTGMKKVIPVAKKTMVSVVKKGMKKAVPLAKKMVKKGVKRAAEEAQTVISNKIRKVEDMAINKGVPAEMAHSLSTVVEDGSRQGIDTLSKLAGDKSDQLAQKVSRYAEDSDSEDSQPATTLKQRQLYKSKIKRPYKARKQTLGARRRRIQGSKLAADIQNLIDDE